MLVNHASLWLPCLYIQQRLPEDPVTVRPLLPLLNALYDRLEEVPSGGELLTNRTKRNLHV